MSPRSLVVDSHRSAGVDRVRTRGEALQRMMSDEYDTIELHTARAGRDDYDLVAYLSGTWPEYLQQVTVRTITRGRTSAEWNHEKGEFVATPRRAGRRERGQDVALATPARLA